MRSHWACGKSCSFVAWPIKYCRDRLRINNHLSYREESPMSLSQRLVEYISACFTGLWVQSHEHDDALAEIAQMCRDQDWRLAVWDVERGLHLPGQANGQTADAGGNDPLAAIRSLNAMASADSSALLVMVNFHRFLQSAEIVQALAQQISSGKTNRTFVVVLVRCRAGARRAGEAVRRAGARPARPRATARDRPWHRHRRRRTAGRCGAGHAAGCGGRPDPVRSRVGVFSLSSCGTAASCPTRSGT